MEDDPCPVAIACRQVAKKVFGIDHLRFGQLEAAVAAVEKKDSIVVLPTGAGKSRCFQLVPSILKELQRPKGLVMVIQPLLMLLKTQTEDLRSLGLEAGVDAQSDIRDQQVLIKARRGDLDFCKWTSPFMLFCVLHCLVFPFGFRACAFTLIEKKKIFFFVLSFLDAKTFIVYVCPETLTDRWKGFLSDLSRPVSLFVIDEFHGMVDLASFRPDYTKR